MNATATMSLLERWYRNNVWTKEELESLRETAVDTMKTVKKDVKPELTAHIKLLDQLISEHN